MSNQHLVAHPQNVESYSSRSLTAVDIRHRVNTIQEVMTAVMKRDVHYGIIPGCKKPSLYKPGSEVLLATFQIATSIHVTDLSTDDCIRYQVRVIGTHAPSGMLLGEGIGECSSNEEKYKWRKAYDDEYSATAENRRRIKFGKYKDKQVRTEPADVANTILKMAKKRAQIDMTLTTTGASDCFEQDVEDLPEEYLAEIATQRAPKHAATVATPVDSPARDALLASLQDVADTGMAALSDQWKAIGDDNRKMIGAAALEALKARAAKADAASAELEPELVP